MRPLLKRAEAKVKRHQFQMKQKKRQAEIKAARKVAIQLLAMQAPAGAFAENERDEVGEFDLPHSSHKILALQGEGDTIYCKRCGCWSAKVKLRHLASPCLGMKAGNKSSLRLLECGVMPSPGATIPSHLKLRYGSRQRRRKSRW